MAFTWCNWLDSQAGLCDQRSKKPSLSFPEAKIHCTHLGGSTWRQRMSLYAERPQSTCVWMSPGPPMLPCALFLTAQHPLPLNRSLMGVCSVESCESFQIFKLVKSLKLSKKVILILFYEGTFITIYLNYFRWKCFRYMCAYVYTVIKVKTSFH